VHGQYCAFIRFERKIDEVSVFIFVADTHAAMPSFHMEVRGPFAFQYTRSYYGRVTGEVVDVFEGGYYRRVVATGARDVLVSVQPLGDVAEPQLEVTCDRLSTDETREVVRWVRRIFNLDLDLPAFYDFAVRDPLLAPVTRAFHGFRPPRFATLFEALICTILGQQVNVRFALDVKARLVRRFGRAVTHEGRTYYGFPTPDALACASPTSLRALRVSRQKARYITGIAQRVLDGALTEDLASLDDDSLIRHLTAITGIGRWSAEYVLVRGLGRTSVIPAAGTGIRAAFAHYHGRVAMTEVAVRHLAERWGRYKGLAAFYLRFAYHRSRDKQQG
jgi:DNA-3-methyladenine glycosylase II